GCAAIAQSEIHAAEQTTVMATPAVGKTETPTAPATETSDAERPHLPVADTEQSNDKTATALPCNSKSNSDLQLEDAIQIDSSAALTNDTKISINAPQNS